MLNYAQNLMKISRMAVSAFSYTTGLSEARMTEGKKYDFVVYGATGFTGQYVVEQVARLPALGMQPLNWAVAGRNKQKLENSLHIANTETGVNVGNVGVIIADSEDEASIRAMAAQAKVLINCVGPYHLYGEPVVKACIEHNTSQVDISGEFQFAGRMQLKYDKAAEESGSFIVSACGFDSIPAEIGMMQMANHFSGQLNSVELFVTMRSKGVGLPPIHTGTMESAALAITHYQESRDIKRQLFPTPLPKPEFPIENRGWLHKNSALNRWCIPIPVDGPVVYRTQRYFHDVLNEPSVQFSAYMCYHSIFQALGTFFAMAFFVLMSYFTVSRNFLFKYPEILTAGTFTRAGATREQLKNVSFTTVLVGKGWTQKDPSVRTSSTPDASITVKVSGPDPGYEATAVMMVACARVLLTEKHRCIRKGGVMTPGVAFRNTSIVEFMEEMGMKVEVDADKKTN